MLLGDVITLMGSGIDGSTHPVVADLQHFGKKEEKQVGPGLAMTFRCQCEEISHGVAAHTAKHTDISTATVNTESL